MTTYIIFYNAHLQRNNVEHKCAFHVRYSSGKLTPLDQLKTWWSISIIDGL